MQNKESICKQKPVLNSVQCFRFQTTFMRLFQIITLFDFNW